MNKQYSEFKDSVNYPDFWHIVNEESRDPNEKCTGDFKMLNVILIVGTRK